MAHTITYLNANDLYKADNVAVKDLELHHFVTIINRIGISDEIYFTALNNKTILKQLK